MIEILLLIVLLTTLYICVYRNTKVYFFDTSICDKVFDHSFRFLNSCKTDEDFHKRGKEWKLIQEYQSKILNKYSYSQLLFSFKPLKLKYWFTEDEIEFIERGWWVSKD